MPVMNPSKGLGMNGHFTQMVWATTTEFGCAITKEGKGEKMYVLKIWVKKLYLFFLLKQIILLLL